MNTTLVIEKLSHEGRGIAHQEGRVVFVEGALPGETVTANIYKKNPKFMEGRVVAVEIPSQDRVSPKCAVFGVCGGCSLQHMPSQLQIEFKQSMLAEQFQHFAGTLPEIWLPPLQKETFGYRSKARLGVKYVPKKGGVLVGFREKGGKYLTQMNRCEVLSPVLGDNLEQIQSWIFSLSIRDQIPQLECAVDDQALALIVRHLTPFSEEDLQKTREWVDAFPYPIIIYLQSKGPETIKRFYPEGPELLSYRLPEFDLTFSFAPSDFTQVNQSLNPFMVRQALDFLDLTQESVVLDLFCGLGNFTLPLARLAGQVVGVEGDEAMTTRAALNAKNNGLSNVSFFAENLFEPFVDKAFFIHQKYDRVLMDPPRAGALEVCMTLAALKKKAPQKIVYISCNPSTLARDAGILVKGGYVMTHAGVMDMFPHTDHVESMAVFEKRE